MHPMPSDRGTGDDKPYRSCGRGESDTRNYSHLGRGHHVFKVFAIGDDGKRDPTPAKRGGFTSRANGLAVASALPEKQKWKRSGVPM